jgi:adenylate cyclase class IV
VLENGLERTIVYRYEINPSQVAVDDLLRQHTKIGTTHKERTIYKIDHVKIHLDRLPDGSEFIEIEAMDINNDFSTQDLQEHCLSMKLKLGIPDSSLVQSGYLIK